MLIEKAVSLALVSAIVVIGSLTSEPTSDPTIATSAQPVDDSAITQEMPRPGEEHKWIAKRVGKWNIASKMRMTPDTPWMNTKATETCTTICGGFWISCEFEGDFMGMKFTGRQTVGFDQHKKKYISTWIDSFGSYMTYSEGVRGDDGKSLHFKGKTFNPTTGTMVDTSMVIVFKNDDEVSMTMRGPDPDGKQFVTMEMLYTRAR